MREVSSVSRRISPEAEMLWSAYDKGECGTAYLKNKMADMETERDDMGKLALELMDALQRLINNGHAYDCSFINYTNGPCDCGLDAASILITKAKEALP